MSSKIKHKVDMFGMPYIEIGNPGVAAEPFKKAYDKFADELVKKLFYPKPKDESDEQIL